MTQKDRYEGVLTQLEKDNPNPESELNYGNNFELLVAVILSAQCTDKRVNLITPELFQRYPTAEELSNASEQDILNIIKSVSYPNSKARHLKQMANQLLTDFNGIVPLNMNELIGLPGVGRKTANVILAVAGGQSAMPVDTHVFRVSHRIGLVPKTCTTPFAVEKYLLKHIPVENMANAHHWLLLHGRYVCKSRTPMCHECKISMFCREFQQLQRDVSKPSQQ